MLLLFPPLVLNRSKRSMSSFVRDRKDVFACSIDSYRNSPTLRDRNVAPSDLDILYLDRRLKQMRQLQLNVVHRII